MQSLDASAPSEQEGTLVIAIVEDNCVVGEAVVAMLARSEGVPMHASAIVDMAQLGDWKPDVFVFDAGRVNANSTRLAAALRQRVPAAKIIATDVAPAREDVEALLQVGVNGIVHREATFDELVSTIRSVVAGNTVVTPANANGYRTRGRTPRWGQRAVRVTGHVHLTAREDQVINFIVDGLSNKEIATRLDVTAFTVKSHVRAIMDKLGLHTRLEIAARCCGRHTRRAV